MFAAAQKADPLIGDPEFPVIFCVPILLGLFAHFHRAHPIIHPSADPKAVNRTAIADSCHFLHFFDQAGRSAEMEDFIILEEHADQGFVINRKLLLMPDIVKDILDLAFVNIVLYRLFVQPFADQKKSQEAFPMEIIHQIPLTELLPDHVQCRLLGPLKLLDAQFFCFLILVQTTDQTIIQSALHCGIGNQMCVFLDVRIVLSDMQEAKQNNPLLWVFSTCPPS